MASAEHKKWHPRFDIPVTERGEMVPNEMGSATVENATSLAFGEMENQWGGAGSPWRSFYEKAATMPGRVIAWNTNRDFSPGHIFFRSVDTGRLLVMDNAPFRVQIWRAPHLTIKEGGNQALVISMIHDLLLLRNFHDLGAADLPVILCDLNQSELMQAMEYWVWLSKKGNTTHPDRAEKFFAVYDACAANRRYPCFLQIDLTVRKILSGRPNPIPPFIIVHSFNRTEADSIKAQILFTKDFAVPPESIMQFWPNTCGGPECSEPDCEPIQMPRDGKEKAWVLNPDGELLSIEHHENLKSQGESWCNHWPCKQKQTPNQKLLRCGKCKEVLYCCQEHQRADWKIHKGVCAKGSNRDPGYNGPLVGLMANGTTQHFTSWHDMVDRRT